MRITINFEFKALVAALVILTPAFVVAECLITKDGKVYYDVKAGLNGSSEDEVTIRHRGGVARVACTNMYEHDKIKYSAPGSSNVMVQVVPEKAAVPPALVYPRSAHVSLPPVAVSVPVSSGSSWNRVPAGAGNLSTNLVKKTGTGTDEKSALDEDAPARKNARPEFIFGQINDQPEHVKPHGDMNNGLRFDGHLPPEIKGRRFVRGVHGAECSRSGVAFAVASAAENYSGQREQLIRQGWAPVAMKIWDDDQRAKQYVIMKKRCHKGEQLGYLETLIW